MVKKLERVRQQLQFDTFKHMVACKIMHEGEFLYGSEEIFHLVKDMLRQKGVIKKINNMEEMARVFREQAEEYLVKEDPAKIRKERPNFFFPSEESEEFE